ncbi:unnamed protein product [Parascedosporium putredinis]|uniref:non-specific serine/threonine protein kinase n=1 Tax=Parascedosporium putredinis TaxID=1442378 RepID=A0A9P1H6A8_9PEZI|nr:unnamed protein product [Parascedosporium putredinis]CAI7997365.1 unnamed protein product [Parascedosporium putredinis]
MVEHSPRGIHSRLQSTADALMTNAATATPLFLASCVNIAEAAQNQPRAEAAHNNHHTVEPPLAAQINRQVAADDIDDALNEWAHTVIQPGSVKSNPNPARKNAPEAPSPPPLTPITTTRSSTARRTPTQRLGSRRGSGLASPQSARSLADWEVEDFVLMATVDGDLYASDRKTGQKRWHLEADQPLIETSHHRANTSTLDDDYHPVDHYIWAVEPSRDGSLYLWIPAAPEPTLVKTGLTMKKLVEELAPTPSMTPVAYLGEKKTTMMTLDAATGRVLKWFGTSGSQVNDAESCFRPNAIYEEEECSSSGTITLGRTEYTVAVQRRDGRPIATIRYAEWVLNTFDHDLLQQYNMPLDQWYITSQHDGMVYAFSSDRDNVPLAIDNDDDTPTCALCSRTSSPAPSGNSDRDSELIILPQPPPPPHDARAVYERGNNVFLNRTDEGSWYALSGQAYPLILSAPTAKIERPEWWQLRQSIDTLSPDQFTGALIGTHHLDMVSGPGGEHYHPPTLPPAQIGSSRESENESVLRPPPLSAEDDYPRTIGSRVKTFQQAAVDKLMAWVMNEVWIPIFVILIIVYQKELRRQCRRLASRRFWVESGFLPKRIAAMEHDSDSESEEKPVGKPSAATARSVEKKPEREPEAVPEAAAQQQADKELTPAAEPESVSEENSSPAPEDDSVADSASSRADSAEAEASLGDRVAEKGSLPVLPEEDESHRQEPSKEAEAEVEAVTTVARPSKRRTDGQVNDVPVEKEKKKAHRGRRGGVKHRKKDKKREASEESPTRTDPMTAVEDAVDKVIRLREPANMEPDVHTLPDDMQSVAGPIIRMGNIEVDMNEHLGTGSNGTLVFSGKFDGRVVAVKRMLIQFYDIASQETKLLRESDDHPNVIRYFAQQVRDGFLYIALERCAASLADVIEKPHMYADVAQAGRNDIPGVLLQITNGISHLHSLRIVHRDLKPQNILVNMGKDGRPRLLVSDFGLCKKLEGGQSSFGATTGRAAGTSGWRAPELLIDDDGSVMADSTHSGSGSVLVGDHNMLPKSRATRSIDIFSLGLVFFYVLTNGCHPFDCGDRYMREVNIRKGNYSLDLLDSLGDFAYEAKDLVSSMLSQDPKTRPTAREVMAHPFFWTTKTRLQFLCDELEAHAPDVTRGDFLKHLPRDFIDSLGKQRKYTGSRLLDLLRALRNKKNHYEDMPDSLKRSIGSLPDGYLAFWTVRFPKLLLVCWNVVYQVQWDSADRFKEYYEPVRT